MDLWQLHIFCKVTELRSFSRAGQAVRLSQPTVSSHIKDLENHFGCRLIDRMAREVVPTRAGELLYHHAKRLLAMKDELEVAISDFQGRVQGHLTAGGSTIPGSYLLPRLLGGFSMTYPDVTVSLVVKDTAEIVEDIGSGVIDLGVVGAKVADKRVVQEKYTSDEMALVVSADHALAGNTSVGAAALTREPFILREPGSGTRRSFTESLKRKGMTVNDLHVVAEMGNTEAIIQAIRSGVGMSVLSRLAVQDELDAGVLHAITVRGIPLKRNFYLTRHRHRSLSPLCKAFLNYLAESAA